MYRKLYLLILLISLSATSLWAADSTYQSPEPALLKQYPSLFKRTGLKLTVNLANGKTSKFVSVVEDSKHKPEDTREYWLQRHYPEVGYALIRSGFWMGEGQSYELLNLKTGAVTDIGGDPELSPDQKRFAVAMLDISAGYISNLLAVYRIDASALTLEFKITPEEWGVDQIRWQTPLSLRFQKGYWEDGQIKSKCQRLIATTDKQGKATWTIK